jgi:hypothetical protein
MKALSLLQPWASLVAIREKRIETRSWSTHYRGPLAIHASARMTREQKELCQSEPFRSTLLTHCIGVINFTNMPLGAVIATCNLVDCLTIEPREDGITALVKLHEQRYEISRDGVRFKLPRMCGIQPLPDEPELSFGDYTPGRYAWLLSNMRLVEPVPCKGALRLWNLPAEIEDAIRLS